MLKTFYGLHKIRICIVATRLSSKVTSAAALTIPGEWVGSERRKAIQWLN